MFGSGNNSGSIFGGGNDNKKDDNAGGSIFGGGGSNKGGGSIFDSKKDSKSSVFDGLGSCSKSTPETGAFGGSGGGDTPSSVFDNLSSPTNVMGSADKPVSEPGAFGGGGSSPADIMGTNSSTGSVSGLAAAEGRHLSGKYEKQGMGIGDADKYSASYLREDRDLTSLNARGSNYGGMNLLDRMRGEQANHLNNDTGSVSMSEQYSDASLDKRAMDGLYNVTLSDIYGDKAKYNAHHGLNTDGKVDIIDNTYAVDTYSDPEVKETSLWGTGYKLDKTFDTGPDAGPMNGIWKKEAQSFNKSIFDKGDKKELSSSEKLIKSVEKERKEKKDLAKKEKTDLFMKNLLKKDKKKEPLKKTKSTRDTTLLNDSHQDKSNEVASKYDKIRQENEKKKQEEKKIKNEMYFKKITDIQLNKEEDILEKREEDASLFLKNEGIVNNKANKEFKDDNELKIIHQKEINNIKIIFCRNNKKELFIGGKEQYKEGLMKPFKLEDNIKYKIDEFTLHLKQIRTNYLCNIEIRLSERNIVFPFEFLLDSEMGFLDKNFKNGEPVKKVKEVYSDNKNDRKKRTKSLLSKIT